MLNQVEVTVAAQPLPRLQAVGSAETVFPFLNELSWGRVNPSPSPDCAAMATGDSQSISFPAPATNFSGWDHSSAPWSNSTGPGWSPRSMGWPRQN